MACYEGVVALAPGHWRALLSLAVALVGLGREDAAGKALRRALKASGGCLMATWKDVQDSAPVWMTRLQVLQGASPMRCADAWHASHTGLCTWLVHSSP